MRRHHGPSCNLTAALPSPWASPSLRLSLRRTTWPTLDDIERLAKEGLHGGLLEQAWCRRALALVREVRGLRERLVTVENRDG